MIRESSIYLISKDGGTTTHSNIRGGRSNYSNNIKIQIMLQYHL